VLQVAPSVARGQRRHPPRRGPRLRVTHSRAPSPSPAPPRPHRTIGPSPELLRRPGPPSHATETRHPTRAADSDELDATRAYRDAQAVGLGRFVSDSPESERGTRRKRPRLRTEPAVGRRTASEEQTCALTRGRDCFRVDTSDVWSLSRSSCRDAAPRADSGSDTRHGGRLQATPSEGRP
jgi:hypothetical protein